MPRCLGKRPVRHDPRTLRLARYLDPKLPPPPAAAAWSKRAAAPWGMMLNDTLGDCTIASIGHGIQVLTANSGAKALEILAKGKPPVDLVITDLVMPAMSGRELVERIQAMPRARTSAHSEK